jgi:hypothetical protein
MTPTPQLSLTLSFVFIHLISLSLEYSAFVPVLVVLLHFRIRRPLCITDTIKARHDLRFVWLDILQLHLQSILNPQPDLNVILGYKRNCVTAFACSRCSSDPMDVCCTIARYVEVYDDIH